MEKNFISYPVSFSNRDVVKVVNLLEGVTLEIERDLLITALLTYAIGLQDPDIFEDGSRFQDTLDSVGQHICWVLTSGNTNPVDPKDYN